MFSKRQNVQIMSKVKAMDEIEKLGRQNDRDSEIFRSNDMAFLQVIQTTSRGDIYVVHLL